MADTKSLRLIGAGLSTVTVLVTLVAAVLVLQAPRSASEMPTVYAAAR